MTLQHYLSNSENQYAELLSSSFYGDNLQSTSDSWAELLEIYNAAYTQLGKVGMILRQWNAFSDD